MVRTIAGVIAFLAMIVGLLLVTGSPATCGGRCPTLADGSCDPAIALCGTGKKGLGFCQTIVNSRGRLTCGCSVR